MENECTIISNKICLKPKISPLKSKTSMNSLNRQEDESKKGLKKPDKLERQYTDLKIRYTNLNDDYTTLRRELDMRVDLSKENSVKIKELEKFIRSMQFEYNNEKLLLTDSLKASERTIFDLNLKLKKMNTEFIQDDQYSQLSLDYKILSSNYELELSAKKFLLAQIDNLNIQLNDLKLKYENLQITETKAKNRTTLLSDLKLDNIDFSNPNLLQRNEKFENDDLGAIEQEDYSSQNLDSIHNNQSDSDESVDYELDLNSVIHHQVEHTMNESTDDEDGDYDDANQEDTDVLGDIDETNESYQINNTFEFPAKSNHNSLPADFEEEFILSPLKLANQTYDSDGSRPTSGQFSRRVSCQSRPVSGRFSPDKESRPLSNRYSQGHSRYNSHDFCPIQVEFEPIESRSVSVPILQKESIEEDHEEDENDLIDNNEPRIHAFNKLNGDLDQTVASTYRNSIIDRNSMISTSSKRSSLNDEVINKQEFMKLKFELQSLKLQNEKLLSYIGFELQKHINLDEFTKNVEYSDSKLIEQSRLELIHKKRVLRSVSINSILSKNYNNPTGILNIGVLEDDYGFINEINQYPNRIFSRGLQKYLNDNEVDDDINNNKLKNHKSLKNIRYTIDENLDVDTSFSSSEEELGIIGQFKYMILGSNEKNKKKKDDGLVDDRLKYKFVAITLGIMIIGLKFSHQNVQR